MRGPRKCEQINKKVKEHIYIFSVKCFLRKMKLAKCLTNNLRIKDKLQ